MANVDFDMTVQQTVINVTDQTGETFEVTPQPKVEVSVAEGSGSGGSSFTRLTDSEYEQFKLHMIIVTGTILPKKFTPESGEK